VEYFLCAGPSAFTLEQRKKESQIYIYIHGSGLEDGASLYFLVYLEGEKQ
jgi:hypothetical protein